MINKYKTEQEQFWAGEFGDEYINRNKSSHVQAGKLSFFSRLLSNTTNIKSCIEFGPNVGLNLKAIKLLCPDIELSAVEINEKAVEELKSWGEAKVYHQSILEFDPDYERDIAFFMGVLIHLNPDMLPQVYDILYRSSSKYILIAEYYNPTPVAIKYRGHDDKLFKRDFAGEMMDKYPDLELINYGFLYHRDNNFPMDDITWFLLKKN